MLKKIIHGLSKPITIFILSAIAIIIGFYGYIKDHYSIGESAYRAVSFFVIQAFADEKEGVNGFVEFGRWTAILVVVITAIRTVYILTRDYWHLARLRTIKNHILICGLGDKGYRLVKDYQRLGNKVVIIERNPENINIDLCRENGAIVIIGSANDNISLKRARPSFAKMIFIATDDDKKNAEIASKVYQYTGKETTQNKVTKRSQSLPCFVHIFDPVVISLVKAHEMYTRTDDILELRIFNLFERGARKILNQYAPDKYIKIHSKEDDAPVVLLIGFDNTAQSILLQAALIAHYANEKNLCFIVIDKDLETGSKKFLYYFPAVTEFLDIEWVDIDPNILRFEDIEKFNRTITVAYFCLPEIIRSIYIANFCIQKASKQFDCIICTHAVSGILESYKPNPKIRIINVFDSDAVEQNLLEEEIDTIAKAIHEDYAKKYSLNTPWENLEKEFRDSNRNAAMHLEIKFRTINACLKNQEESNAIFDFTSDVNIVEKLAKMEHRRWFAEKRLAGWKYSPGRNNEKKLHPNLVTFDELPKHIKEQNYDIIKSIPTIFQKINKVI